MIDMARLSSTEERLLDIMQHASSREVVAVGIVEIRAAMRFVDAGMAEYVSEGTLSRDNWGAGSIRIRLTPGI